MGVLVAAGTTERVDVRRMGNLKRHNGPRQFPIRPDESRAIFVWARRSMSDWSKQLQLPPKTVIPSAS
jgi:hypothetical protein